MTYSISTNNTYSDKTKGYPKSFSCGILKVPDQRDKIEVMDIIKQADAMM